MDPFVSTERDSRTLQTFVCLSSVVPILFDLRFFFALWIFALSAHSNQQLYSFH
jgi:hypothetical protein